MNIREKKVKVLELIKDWSLWPRYEANDLDATNVKRIKDALKAGLTLPPIIADKESYRIVDGFHRVEAYLSVYGEDAEIDVEFKNYKNDTEMFLESAKLNCNHGLPLSPKDITHVILTARRKKVPLAKIGEALGMTKERIKQFEQRRTATTRSGEKIPLSFGASSLAGKTLNKDQEHFARGANGMVPIINARLLMNALKASAFPLTENEVKVLMELRDVIERVLSSNGIQKKVA